jgi:hypothetical protein
MISANCPYRNSQFRIGKLNKVRRFSSNRPVDAQRAPKTAWRSDVMSVLIQIFFVECVTVVLIGSNKLSQIIALTARDQKLW